MMTAEVSRWMRSCSIPRSTTHMSESQLSMRSWREESITSNTICFTLALNSLVC